MIPISEEIRNKVKEVIQYSQNINNPNVDSLLEQWAVNKNTFFTTWFNESLIKNCGEASFELSQESKELRYITFVDGLARFDPYTYELIKFLRSISIKEFFDNHLKENYITKEKIILKGTKIVKAFKYFITNERLLQDLQNEASEIIQENKVSGTLYMSIHPLDYLSLSENCHNWRSCHALDGEYRAGNLSYMCDNTTVIFYLSDNKEYKLPRFPESVPWNSKKWRCLLFSKYRANKISYSMFGRQYPFFSEVGLSEMRKVLMSIVPIYDRKEYTDIISTKGMFDDIHLPDGSTFEFIPGEHLVFTNKIINKHDLIEDVKGSCHYNDLLYSSCYQPYYMVHKHTHVHPGNTLQVGSVVRCLCCGEENITSKDSMYCHICSCERSEDDDWRCECCGQAADYDDLIYVDDMSYCPRCYSNYTFTCKICGERHNNNLARFSDTINDYICVYCAEDSEEE